MARFPAGESCDCSVVRALVRRGHEVPAVADLSPGADDESVIRLALPVVARLLGRSDIRMTMRYAHVGDREIEAAAERVGQVITSMMAG